MRWRSLGETKSAHKNTDKTGTNQLDCFAIATTWCYHQSSGPFGPLSEVLHSHQERQRAQDLLIARPNANDQSVSGICRRPLYRIVYRAQTRQALAAAKARGVILGSPKLSKARESAVASIKASADQHAANILPIIKEAQKAGATSLRAVAEALNARGISTARGGAWHAMSVKNVLDRPMARKTSQTGQRS
jgi:hypothetical protein